MNRPQAWSSIGLMSMPRLLNSRSASSMSLTTTCMPTTEPGSASVIPLPMADRAGRTGRGQLDESQVFADRVIVVGIESEADVEVLGAVDVGDGNGDQFELDVHDVPFM